jgi:predicted O-methyltransferase YrrM
MSNTHYKVEGKALALCNAFGFLFPGELFLIQALVQSLPEQAVVVNIGAGVGTGSLAMVEMKPSLQAFTVDISAGGPFGGLENEVNAFRDAGFPERTPIQILGDSQVVWKGWPDISHGKKIDLLFIDGDHSETGLQKDIDGWLQYIKPGGYVLYHDYNSVAWGDVTKTVDRNMNQSLEWQHVLTVDTLIAFRRIEIPLAVPVITKKNNRATK